MAHLSTDMAMQVVQMSSAFMVTMNSYLSSKREFERRARRLRRARMLLLLRLMQMKDEKTVRQMTAQLPPPKPLVPPVAAGRYWEVDVPQFSEAQFQKEFHVSKRTFSYLCNALRSVLAKGDSTVTHIPLEKRIATALSLLAAKEDYNTIAANFGITKNIISVIFKDFCNAVVNVLFGKVVQLPSGSGFREEADKFALRYLFPDCIGVVGATHLPVATPRNCGPGYTNSSGWNSIVLLGVAGFNNKLGYVCIGQPGSTDNTSVLKASQLYKTAQKGKLFPTDEDLHFLADGTFPLLKWLVTPFSSEESTSQACETYNYHLKNAHKCVEASFDRLKGRWGLLLKGCDLAMDFTKVVQVCCVLHNLCEGTGDMFFEYWYENVRNFNSLNPQPQSKPPSMERDEEDDEDEEDYEELLAEASAKRDRIAERLVVSAAAAAAAAVGNMGSLLESQGTSAHSPPSGDTSDDMDEDL